MIRKKLIIVGGGAAGFFTAANVDGDKYDILILEQAKEVLQKVKISGGGRCNVTHACFDPKELVSFYPRGSKELLGVFSNFQPGDTMAWFSERNVDLKIESDQRVFPTSDSSQSIIDCLVSASEKNHAQIHFQERVKEINPVKSGWEITTSHQKHYADAVVFCTGSSPKAYEILKNLDLNIIELVPSLFTFHIKNKVIQGFMGTSFPDAEVKIPQINKEAFGPLLITHWGLSGPAILKLSAWAARELHALKYQFEIVVNFLGIDISQAEETFLEYKKTHPKKTLGQAKIFNLTHRFWIHLLKICHLNAQQNLAETSHKEMFSLLEILCKCKMQVTKKSTFKEEFVTAGGVDLKEIDFRNMQSKKHPGFYLAGEVLNIDAVTGGFNFQACWSEAWLISQDLNSK